LARMRKRTKSGKNQKGRPSSTGGIVKGVTCKALTANGEREMRELREQGIWIYRRIEVGTPEEEDELIYRQRS